MYCSSTYLPLAIRKNILNFRVNCDIMFPVHFFVAVRPERRLCMAVNYNKLWKMMIDKKMSKTELTHLAGISTNAMARPAIMLANTPQTSTTNPRIAPMFCTAVNSKTVNTIMSSIVLTFFLFSSNLCPPSGFRLVVFIIVMIHRFQPRGNCF